MSKLLRRLTFAGTGQYRTVLQNRPTYVDFMSVRSGHYMTPRGGVWHYYRRVPAEFAHFDPRPHIKLSTKIKVKNDPSGARAARIAAGINEGVEAHWRTLAAGKISEARQAYDNAVKI